MLAIYLSSYVFSCRITSKLLKLLLELVVLNTFTTPPNPSPVFGPTLSLFGKLILRLASRFAILLCTYVKKYLLTPSSVLLVIVVYPNVSSLIFIGLTRIPPIIKSFAISSRFIVSVVVLTKLVVPRNVAFCDMVILFAAIFCAVNSVVAFTYLDLTASFTSILLNV